MSQGLGIKHPENASLIYTSSVAPGNRICGYTYAEDSIELDDWLVVIRKVIQEGPRIALKDLRNVS